MDIVIIVLLLIIIVLISVIGFTWWMTDLTTSRERINLGERQITILNKNIK